MNALYYDTFQGPISPNTVPDPAPVPGGVVLRVEATGLCLSDWHGWQGHDADIVLPHVPGHELAGVVEAVGTGVTRWQVGDRVTLPFVCGCGTCPQCASGNHQVCDRQFQPGFTHWGSFAEYVSIHYADVNLVRLPEAIAFGTAAGLGCRFATAFRGVVAQGGVQGGQWVAVHGCGGVGLSAVMIAAALGAQVVAVDIAEAPLALAKSLGAVATVNARQVADVVEAVRAASGGGVHVSVDALGSATTCFNSVANLRKRGIHVQIGLMTGPDRHPPLPMDLVVAQELVLKGSHGMQAHHYDQMLAMIEAGTLKPDRLVRRRLPLAAAAEALMHMDRFDRTGVTVITPFG